MPAEGREGTAGVRGKWAQACPPCLLEHESKLLIPLFTEWPWRRVPEPLRQRANVQSLGADREGMGRQSGAGGPAVSWGRGGPLPQTPPGRPFPSLCWNPPGKGSCMVVVGGQGREGRQRSSSFTAWGQPSGPVSCTVTWWPVQTPLGGLPPERERTPDVGAFADGDDRGVDGHGAGTPMPGHPL